VTSREDVARALAFFDANDDVAFLRQLLQDVAPKVRRMVAVMLERGGGEDAIPPPADLRAARQPASRNEAIATLHRTSDFSLLQVLTRAIGRRIEAIEIVASAEFPAGARVVVPENGSYPPAGPLLAGTVEEAGTTMQVLLDNGETWRGPPSLAARESPGASPD
jgi:hypothetical protein